MLRKARRSASEETESTDHARAGGEPVATDAPLVSGSSADGAESSGTSAADIRAWIEMDRISLRDVLSRRKIRNLESAMAVATDADAAGRDQGEALIAAGFLKENEWVEVLAERFGLPIAAVDEEEPDKAAIAVVGEDLARRHTVLPFRISGDRVYVATADPLDAVAIEELAEKCEHLGLMVASRTAIRRNLEREYDALLTADAAIAAFGLVDDSGEFQAAANRPTADENAPIVQVVNRIVTQGVRNRASDIHIEPLEHALRVRYRIDGSLSEAIRLPARMASPIASRVKVLAELNIVERRRPQDGQFSTEVDGRPIDIRTSVISTIHGEKVVLRLLDKTRSLIGMDKLGMGEELAERYLKVVNVPVGMFLCTGPTGSGKTTSLYATLAQIQDDARNVVTIEDPVEYEFEGINQMQVHEAGGFTFADGLRGTLRQDPDVILVGEIRDVETARIAMQAALTGHLVLSSLHSVDAVSAIHRFVDMGIEPFLISAAVNGIIGQRLVRRICTACRKPYEPTAAEREMVAAVLGTSEGEWAKGEGCNACSHTGFHGRVGVYELMRVNEVIRKLIVERASHAEIRDAALADGMRTMQVEGFSLVLEGQTTLDEVLRTVYAPVDEGESAGVASSLPADPDTANGTNGSIDVSGIEVMA